MKRLNNFNLFKKSLQKQFRKKHNKMYYYGNRHNNRIHARLRMKCSTLKDDLYKLFIIDDPSCMCGKAAETAKHYFFHCELYVNQRKTLMNTIEDFLEIPKDKITLDMLLNGHVKWTIDENEVLFLLVYDFFKTTHRFENT